MPELWEVPEMAGYVGRVAATECRVRGGIQHGSWSRYFRSLEFDAIDHLVSQRAVLVQPAQSDNCRDFRI